DDPDPIAVTIEGDAEVAMLAGDGLLQLNEILRHRRIGMMRRKGSVDHLVQQNVPAGQAGGQLADDLAGRAVPGIPGDGQRARAITIARQPGDVVITDRMLGDLTADLMGIPESARDLTQLLDRRSVKRL